MAAIASNTAQLLEDDPRLKLVASFLSDVMHIEHVEQLSFGVRQSRFSEWQMAIGRSTRPEWEVTVTVPGVDGKMIFIVEQVIHYQIGSVAFFPGWQPENKVSER